MYRYLNTEGSTWRKWDLHIHSPESVLHSEFSGDWVSYLQSLENLTDISVIGITDYYSIDGFKQILKKREEGRVSNIDLVIPNIELRLDKTTNKGKPINIHILFDPSLEPTIIEDYFLSELEFNYQDTPYKCTRRDLMSLGEFFYEGEYSEKKALKAGMMQYKVSIEMIDKILKKHRSKFKDRFLIGLPNSNVDGNSGLRDDSFKAVRRQIYHFADFIFSGNPNDRTFFLGEKSVEETIEQCGKIMPCLHGSDAHSLEKIGRPDQDRFTWIKAEPTFEGLKQIVHEPKNRVVIQSHHPDQKNDYDVISSIRFKSESGIFTDREIQLNPGLNTIIGGKSSGKSLLLYKVAQSISRDEIKTREKEELWKNPYINTFIESSDFEVKWRNGNITNQRADQVGRITYIPQMYINALSEDSANDELQEKIKSILLQDPEKKVYLEAKREQLRAIKRRKLETISNLFELIESKSEKISEIEKIGDEQSIIMEIQKIEADVKEKLSLSALSQEEEQRLEQNEALKNKLKTNFDNMSNQKESWVKVSNRLMDIYDQVNDSIKHLYNTEETAEIILEELRQEISQSFINAQTKIQNDVQRVENDQKVVDEKINNVQKLLDPLIKKTKNRKEIQQIKDKLDMQKRSLASLKDKKEVLDNAEKRIESITLELAKLVEDSLNINKSVLDYFNNSESINEIKVDTKIFFQQDSFEENFLSKFVRRGRMSNVFPRCEDFDVFTDDGEFKFDENTYVNKLVFLVKSILSNDDIKLKKGFTKRQAIDTLFENYIEVIFDLRKENDTLSEMSPGKRGLVLLELFLNISDESHPILIDQPEDNLDNRTITTDLVKFIKEKSMSRQIIIVTHNANLVVLTDSENVIVANQDPLLAENDSHRFEYINGALECDFNIEESEKISSKGIKSHVCEILEGGKDAFSQREKKYGFNY
ncbi:TrlF family AAA-like ATPase [Rossellomorea aquimaris]|uniref:TrlF family AAA-like ATPase n=1 Tax=Rossellomorea aquimaris TaxID=189382 RepID=UPI001CFD53A2|nr:hypothetical protein [Rossellomorea aquimaris]